VEIPADAGASGPVQEEQKFGILWTLVSSAMVIALVNACHFFEIDHAIPYVLAAVFLLVGLTLVVRQRRGPPVPAETRPVS
jgi:predicted Na+-dependent transporter